MGVSGSVGLNVADVWGCLGLCVLTLPMPGVSGLCVLTLLMYGGVWVCGS